MTFPTDSEIQEAAKGCKTLQELWHKLPAVKDFQAMRRKNEQLGLGLPLIRKERSGKPREGRECPKPQPKGKKP